MERVFIVNSKMMPVGRMRKKAVPTGNAKKILGGLLTVDETEVHEEFEQTGQSDCQVDSHALALDVETKLQELAAAGYGFSYTANSLGANPPNTTEWIAPSRAHASIAIAACGIMGI